jgi:DNA-binding SARP family transcriptional activator
VLGALLLRPGQPVLVDWLAELVWAGNPPGDFRSAIQTYVSRLRSALAPYRAVGERQLIRRSGNGYLINIDPNAVDISRFDRLVKRARAADDLAERSRLLTDALSLWRGPAFADVEPPELRDRLAGHLDQQRLSAVRLRVTSELARGRHEQVSDELAAAHADYPFDDGLTGQWMLALYRCGRRAEALNAYRRARRRLADELGLEPGEALQRLEQAILRNDPSLEPPATPTDDGSGEGGDQRPQLPATIGSFVGREDYLVQLDALLDAGDDAPQTVIISAIAGIAGVGKTALALRWGHRVLHRFPDGQLFVDLRGYSTDPPLRPVEALAILLRALGVPSESIPVEQDDATELYRSQLAGKRVLILLDNAGAAEQVRSLLPGAGHCLVVATSRNRLAGLVATEDATVIDLDVLSPAEATVLLRRIAGAPRVDAEPAAAERLAEACGYLPLALRIAGAYLSGRADVTVEWFVQQLIGGDRLAKLAIEGDPKASVAAAFEQSYRRLPSELRRLFRLLALLPGPEFSAETAAALCDMTIDDATAGLDLLVAANLVISHVGRYRLHDLLRLYARKQTQTEDSQTERCAARERAFAWHDASVDAAARVLYPYMGRLPRPPEGAPGQTFEDGRAAVAWLDAERTNLTAAITDSAEHGPRPMAWRLADGLRGYFWQGRYTTEWLVTGQDGLRAAEAERNAAGQAAAHLSLATAYYRLGRYVEATEHWSATLRLARDAGWPTGEASALSGLGLGCRELGRLTEAAGYYRESVALARREHNQATESRLLTQLGFTSYEAGKLGDAKQYFTQAMAIGTQIGNRANLTQAHVGLGLVAAKLGLLDEALHHHSEAVSLCREFGDHGEEFGALANVADAMFALGRRTEALEAARTSLRIARELDDQRVEAEVRNIIGAILRAGGDANAALAEHRLALELSDHPGRLPGKIEAVLGIADTLCATGDVRAARRYAEKGVALVDQSEYGLYEGQAHTVLARACLASGDGAAAQMHVFKALDCDRRTGNRADEIAALALLDQIRTSQRSNAV